MAVTDNVNSSTPQVAISNLRRKGIPNVSRKESVWLVKWLIDEFFSKCCT